MRYEMRHEFYATHNNARMWKCSMPLPTSPKSYLLWNLPLSSATASSAFILLWMLLLQMSDEIKYVCCCDNTIFHQIHAILHEYSTISYCKHTTSPQPPVSSALMASMCFLFILIFTVCQRNRHATSLPHEYFRFMSFHH